MDDVNMVKTRQGHLRVTFFHKGRDWSLFLSAEDVAKNWLACQGKKLGAGESFGTYVDRRIEEVFNDLAGEAGDVLAEEYKDDPDSTPIGAMAFELMDKSLRLKDAWRKIAEEEGVENV